MLREMDIYQVDAFTDVLFGGNPAGVMPDATGLSDDVMQKIAREMALSETAFIIDMRQKEEAAGGPDSVVRGRAPTVCGRDPAISGRDPTVCGSDLADFHVRFFTPWNEVDLCGHATIGSFWLLAELGIFRLGEGETRVFQQTKAGCLPVDITGGCEGKPARVMMTQNVPTVVGELAHDEIVELEGILGAPKGSVTGFKALKGAVPQVVTTGLPDLIVPVVSREALLSMRPNMAALIDFCNARKIISVHAFSLETLDPASTVHCRDFSPAVGVPEESATGTASGATGGYLVLNRLVKVREPVTKIVCEQGYILKRPSIIHVEVESKGSQVTGVRVGGSAVIAIRGKVQVPQ